MADAVPSVIHTHDRCGSLLLCQIELTRIQNLDRISMLEILSFFLVCDNATQQHTMLSSEDRFTVGVPIQAFVSF